MFTLAQLTTFRVVARLGSFSRAAEELGITQPAVTRQVRLLEESFGLPLVEVVNRQTRITEAGTFLANRAEELLVNVAALQRDIQDYAAGTVGVLEVGATFTIGTYALPALLATFRARHPRVTLNVDVGNTTTLLQRVQSGRLGLALVEGSVAGDPFDVTEYQSDDLVLVVPAHGHRFSARSSVRPAELRDETLILRESGSGTRSFVDRALRQAGIRAPSIIGLPSAEAAMLAVDSQLGVAIVPTLAANAGVRAGRVRVVGIDGVTLRRWFKLVKLKSHALSPPALAFAAIVRKSAG